MDETYTSIPQAIFLVQFPPLSMMIKKLVQQIMKFLKANMQTFPPANGGDNRKGSYQTIGISSEASQQQPSNNWRGVFSIASYTQYFNVDTDVVWNRMLCS